jgi:hypothetical protein
MVDKIRRARRIAGIAFGAVRAIFRSGRAWGSAKTRLTMARRPTPTFGAAAGVAAGAAGAFFLDPQSGKRRRHIVVDKLKALARRGAADES